MKAAEAGASGAAGVGTGAEAGIVPIAENDEKQKQKAGKEDEGSTAPVPDKVRG